MFAIEFTEGAVEDLNGLAARDRRQVLARIDNQLTHTPRRQTRNRKIIVGLKPPWDHEDPIWELRVGTWRVFYDVDQAEKRVVVRAVRKKPPHRITEDIL
jgi:mRNA-degrading endonuclease RelE of RelBE toxin-antitoxin system